MHACMRCCISTEVLGSSHSPIAMVLAQGHAGSWGVFVLRHLLEADPSSSTHLPPAASSPSSVTGSGAAQHRHLVLSARTESLSHISVLPAYAALSPARPRASPGFRNSNHEALYFSFLLHRAS